MVKCYEKHLDGNKRQRVDFSANIKVEMKPVKKDKRVAYGRDRCI